MTVAVTARGQRGGEGCWLPARALDQALVFSSGWAWAGGGGPEGGWGVVGTKLHTALSHPPLSS